MIMMGLFYLLYTASCFENTCIEHVHNGDLLTCVLYTLVLVVRYIYIVHNNYIIIFYIIESKNI